jgi:hypothetical protein
MFHSNRISIRLLFIVLSLAVCLAACVYHGISGKKRITHLANEMIQGGKFTGRFWRVQTSGQDLVALSKYGYRINLLTNNFKNFRPGDSVSFIAHKEKPGSDDNRWFPEKIHVHGTSAFKFWISGLAVVFALLMGCIHLGYAKHYLSLTFKEK